MTAQEEFSELTKAKMKEKGIPFSEAFRCICRERPELADECRAEVLKSQTVFETPPPKAEFTPSPATAELNRLAKDKMKRDGVPFREALLSVARERPLLVSEYCREVWEAKF